MFSQIKAIKNLRDQAKQMQSMLDSVFAEGSAAWGKVKVKINGNQQIISVEIDDALLSDKQKLQDAIRDAVNDAVKHIQKELAVKMRDMGGMDIFKNLGQLSGE